MSKKQELTPELARLLFRYEPETGKLYNRVRTNPRSPQGAEPGTLCSDGRRRMRVRGMGYLVYRVIWLMVYGAWPSQSIDHIDGNRDNNRLENLRDISLAEQNQNYRRAHCTSHTQVLGVSDSLDQKRRKRWRARITIAGKAKTIGRYHTQEEAHAAYVAAKRELHPFGTL